MDFSFCNTMKSPCVGLDAECLPPPPWPAQVPDETELKVLSTLLTENNVQHKLWTEQPENYPTCLATKPALKDDIQIHFKKYKLFK